MGGVCTTSCRPQIPKDENSPVKTSGHYLKRKKIFSGGFNLANGLSNQSLNQDGSSKSLFDSNEKLATINLNQASEEDLMIVPGVNRALAHRIVDYRAKIGQFRRIEDLAPCIGAFKFEKLQNEFHVSTLLKIPNSTKSLASTSSDYTQVSSLLSINTATIVQLARIPYLGENIGRKIVNYRQKHGYFQHINDLVDPAKILDVHTFMKVKSYLSVSKKHSRLARRNSTAVISYTNGSIGPTCIISNRPSVKRRLDDKIEGKSLYWVCSWNLQKCDLLKIENPGVKEVVCMTILENAISIVAIQGCCEQKVLEEIVKELNNPTLPNVQRHKENSKSWKCVSQFDSDFTSSHQGVGFIWNQSNDVSYSQAFSSDLHLSATFKVGESKLNLVTIYWNEKWASEKKDQNFEKIVKIAKVDFDSEKAAVLVTTDDSPINLETDHLHPLLKHECTDITSTNMLGSQLVDNIYLNTALMSTYANKIDVIRAGLCNPWIPDGWKWGGLASNHCPVVAEFFLSTEAL